MTSITLNTRDGTTTVSTDKDDLDIEEMKFLVMGLFVGATYSIMTVKDEFDKEEN